MITRFTLLLSFLLLVNLCLAQINDTQHDRYAWNKKDTDPAKGYVVLKSGTKMDGTIVLKGKPGNITAVHITKDGKELKLKPASLERYGLYAKPLENDSPDDMYEWRGKYQLMQDTIQKSKEKRGYAIMNDGTRYDGDLYLIKVNGQLDEIIVKTDNGKKVLRPPLVANYGLVPTIADLTNNGKKIHDLPARNFHPGHFVQSNGEKVEGILAFRYYDKIRKTGATLYQTLYFTPSADEPLTTIESFSLDEVVQVINGTPVSYLPYEEGFVEASKMGGLDAKQQLKLMQPGRICLSNNTIKQGTLAQTIEKNGEFATAVKFKEENGAPVSLKPYQVLWFEQNIKDQTYKSISAESIFVTQLFEGKVFTMYKNPLPKTINEGATKRARNGVAAAAYVATRMAISAMKAPETQNDGWRNDLVYKIETASDQELKDYAEFLMNFPRKNLSKDGSKNMNKVIGAIAAEQIRRKAHEIVIYNVEYIFINKKSGERQLLTKAGFGDHIEPLLQSCENYLFMQKKDQKELRDLDNVDRALQMLDDCYVKAAK